MQTILFPAQPSLVPRQPIRESYSVLKSPRSPPLLCIPNPISVYRRGTILPVFRQKPNPKELIHGGRRDKPSGISSIHLWPTVLAT